MQFPRATRHCQDYYRRGRFPLTSFVFLGFMFRPREARNGNTGKLFTRFLPAVAPEALKKMSRQLREMRIHRKTGCSLDDLAAMLNPVVAGWMNYYGRFHRTELYPLLQRVNTYLTRWARNKYKRLRRYRRLAVWWSGLIDREPRLFVHWRWDRSLGGYR